MPGAEPRSWPRSVRTREPSFIVVAFTVVAGCGNSFSTAARDAGASDTSPDAGPRSGDARPDVVEDAALKDAASDATWCATQDATFCEDFDEQSDIGTFLGTWSVQQTGGSFSFDTVGAPSQPNALRVMGASGAQLLVVKTFSKLAKRPSAVRLSFDLRINSPGAGSLGSAAGLAAIAFGDSVAAGYVTLALSGAFTKPILVGAWANAAGSHGDGGPFNIAESKDMFPTLGAWNSFAIAIDFGKPGSACLHAFNGPSELLVPCLPLPPSLSDPGVVSIALGDYAGGVTNTGDIDVEFDNVTYEVAP